MADSGPVLSMLDRLEDERSNLGHVGDLHVSVFFEHCPVQFVHEGPRCRLDAGEVEDHLAGSGLVYGLADLLGIAAPHKAVSDKMFYLYCCFFHKK